MKTNYQKIRNWVVIGILSIIGFSLCGMNSVMEPELATQFGGHIPSFEEYATVVATAMKEKYGKQIFATPKKQGAETAEANMNAGLAAANQIVGYFATGCTKYQVNK